MGFRSLPFVALFAVGACGTQDVPVQVISAPLASGCGCSAGAWTFVDAGNNSGHTLTSGQSLCIDSGTYTANLAIGSGALVCVDTDAALTVTTINSGGRLVVYGVAGTVQSPVGFTFAAGASIDNFGVTQLGSVNFNGSAAITNYKGAELNFRSSFALRGSGSSLVNDGIFRAIANFDSESGTTFVNNGYGYISGHLAFDGESDNRGLLEITTRVNVNANATFRNTCTLLSHGSYNVNGNYDNDGLAFVYADSSNLEFNVTSPGIVTQGPQGQVILTSSDAATYQANLRVDGKLQGEGSYYVEDNTVCQGSGSAIGTAEAPIDFYDASPPQAPQLFDIQTGTVEHVLRPAAPTLPSLADVRLGSIGSDCRTIQTCTDTVPAGQIDDGCDGDLPVCISLGQVNVCVECAEDPDCDPGYVCNTAVRRCQPGPGPAAANDNTTVAEGSSVSFPASQLATNDTRVDPTTVRLPGGVTSVTTANGTVTLIEGTLTYTPKANPAASDSFTYEVCGLGPNVATCVTATVAVAINRSPDLAPQTRLVAVGTTSVVIDLNPGYSDPDQHAAASYSPTSTQAGTTGIVAGVLTYTPSQPNQPGSRAISVQVCDVGTPSACGTGTVTILFNDPPVLNTVSLQLPRGGTSDVTVMSLVQSLGLVSGDDPSDGDSDGIGTVQVLSGPCVLNGADVSPSAAVASGTIRATAPAALGSATCTVQICEELPPASPAVCSTTTIVINVVTAPPEPVDDTALVAEDGSVLVNVLANDSDPDGDALTVGPTLGTPGHGTVVVEGTQVRYTPTANYNGPDSFTYQACDPSGACTTATVLITVAPDNDPPVALDDVATTPYETPVVIDVVKNDSDPDGDVLTIATVADPPHGSATIVNGKVSYTPDAGYAGADTFTYTVRDPSGATATATVRVTVGPRGNQPPDANDDTATVPEDGRVEIPVLANDTDPNDEPLVIATVSNPPHGTATIDDGAIVYVPDAGYEGPDTFTYSACDPHNACATATVTVTVTHVNHPPIAVADEATTPAGSPVTIDVRMNDSDPDADVLTISSATDPAHGTTAIVAGQVVYTPDADFSGTDTFSYTIRDPAGLTATATVTVVVVPQPNGPPVANNDIATVPGDGEVSIPVLANDTDPDNDPLTIGSVSDPTHGTTTIDGDVISYVPDPGYVGTDTFTYSACDQDAACATATVTVTVTPVAPPNAPPVAVDDTASTFANEPVTIDVLGNDSDPDDDILTIVTVTDPAHGTTTILDGQVVYTPDAGYLGPDTFTYTVQDPSGASDTATVTVIVTPRDDIPPTASDDVTAVDEDGSVSIPVLDNDTDPDGDPLTIASVTQPEHGTTTIVDGEIVYVPDPNYNGDDTFTYVACNAANLCDTATVTVSVTPVNDTPIAVDDGVSTEEDQQVVSDVLANDSDPDGDPLTVVAVTDPEHGTVKIEDGHIVFVPDLDFSGTTTFTYTIQDPSGATSTATVTVTVVSDPDDDDDGLSDEQELALGTDKDDQDSDDDGILDGDEVASGTDPLNPDTDGDGILDGTEIGMDEAISDDTDPAVFVPDLDPSTTTDPLDPDTDHGGIRDGVEDADHNGRVDPGETDPNIEDDDLSEPPLDLTGLSAQGSGGCTGGASSAWALLGGLAIAFAVTPRSRRV